MKPFAMRGDALSRRGLILHARLFFSVLLIVFSLTACSLSDAGSGGRGPSPPTTPQAVAQTPPAPTTMDTFRALAPPEGLKFTPLFAEKTDDDDARFRRLENAVQAMKNDFDTVMPSIVRLVAVEKDIKELVGQLETLIDGSVAAAPVAPVETLEEKLNRIPREDNTGGTELPADSSRVTPEAAPEGQLPPEGAASPSSSEPPAIAQAVAQPLDIKPPAPTPPSAAPPLASGPVLGDVKAIRIGDHMDKTRIVLDMSAKADFTTSLENNGKRLVVNLPQMNFATAKNWEAMSAALVSGYQYENGKLYLDLLYPSQVKSQQVLAPNGSPYHRLVIDLFSQHVHQ